MSGVDGAAPSGVVRFFGGGAPDWAAARAPARRGGRRGGDVGGRWLHRGVDDLREVCS